MSIHLMRNLLVWLAIFNFFVGGCLLYMHREEQKEAEISYKLLVGSSEDTTIKI